MPTPPPIVPRPALYYWMVDRDLSLRDAAKALETTAQTMSLILKPFDDPERRVPQPPLLKRITAWTANAIQYRDFIEPRPERAAA